MDIFDAIRLRRSVKPEKMRPDPIPRATLDRLFDAANWAPSHGHTEPWRFVVHTGDARRTLADAICRACDLASVSDDDPRRQKILLKTSTAPVIIAIVCATSTNPKIVEHEEIASTAIAVHNLHLAARAMGLAAFWSSGKKAFADVIAEHLGIEAPHRCLGFLYVGYPAEPWPESARGDVAAKIAWRS